MLHDMPLAPARHPSPAVAARGIEGSDVVGERGAVAQDGEQGQRDGAGRAPADADRTRWVNLMIRVRDERDRAAFADLFGHFAPRVKAFLVKSGSAPSEAEDCAQDVLVTVWRKAHLYDPRKASVATWIFTIARNRRIDLLRRDRRPEPEDLPWGPEPETAQDDALAMQEESAHLAAALAGLPEKQRRLVEQAYYGDLSHREIADATGLPLGTIKSRLRLALERLRHEMKVR